MRFPRAVCLAICFVTSLAALCTAGRNEARAIDASDSLRVGRDSLEADLGSLLAGVDSLKVTPDTLGHDGFSYAFIPAIFYTPETGVAGGASVLLLFRDKSDDKRPSTVSPTLIFTAKSQIIAVVGYELNFKDDLWRVSGALGYTKFPDLFYGIGPNTPDSNEEEYTPRSLIFGATVQRTFHERLGLGLQYEWGTSEISDVEEGGLLAGGTIPGSDGGTVSGVGPVLSWDTRDNLFYAMRGSFHSVSALFFTSTLGSDFVFERYVIDLRTYVPVLRKNVFAFQAVFSFATGNPPFQLMSALGGSELMRGYYTGRYRDNDAYILQAEWRRRVWWRLGVAAFVGIGDVAPRVGEFQFDNIKPAAGAGVRFVIDRKEGLSIRMDFGFIGGTPGPYLTINEAF
jgi:hypothetical protein